MYPIINIADIILLQTFGIFLIISSVVFFGLLHFFSLRRGITQHIFADIVPFIISTFLFGRIFYIIAEWREEKFIFLDLTEGGGFFQFLARFFLTENYNFSFAGGVIGFLIIYYLKTKHAKKERPLYLDVLIPSFLIASIFGYIGAYYGGQIYGIPYSGLFSINYNTKESIVPFRNHLFPLPHLYIILTICLLAYLYRISKKGHALPDGFIGNLGIGIFGIILFLIEFLNGSSDMISSSFLHINLNQVLGIYFVILAFVGLGKSLKMEHLS